MTPVALNPMTADREDPTVNTAPACSDPIILALLSLMASSTSWTALAVEALGPTLGAA